jgi:hypothetical protein
MNDPFLLVPIALLLTGALASVSEGLGSTSAARVRSFALRVAAAEVVVAAVLVPIELLLPGAAGEWCRDAGIASVALGAALPIAIADTIRAFRSTANAPCPGAAAPKIDGAKRGRVGRILLGIVAAIVVTTIPYATSWVHDGWPIPKAWMSTAGLAAEYVERGGSRQLRLSDVFFSQQSSVDELLRESRSTGIMLRELRTRFRMERGLDDGACRLYGLLLYRRNPAAIALYPYTRCGYARP